MWHDMLGLYPRPAPKFAKAFANLKQPITDALALFESEVAARTFPALQHTCAIADAEYHAFVNALPKPNGTHTFVRTPVASAAPAQTPVTPTLSPSSASTAASGSSTKGKKRVLVVGSGAMGSLLAAKWALRGHEVTLAGRWAEHLAVVQRDGLSLENTAATHPPQQVRGVNVVDVSQPAGVAQLRASARTRPFDAAVFAVKSTETSRAAGMLHLDELMAPGGALLTIQNGLGNAQTLAAAIAARPDVAVLQAVTSTGALMPAAGRVRMTGNGPCALAAVRGNAEAVSHMQELLRDADMQADTSADVEEVSWRKLLINAAINPITALLRVPNGHLLSHPQAAAAATMLATEVFEVARAKSKLFAVNRCE